MMHKLLLFLLIFTYTGCNTPTSNDAPPEETATSPTPNFTVIEGRHQLSPEWSVDLPSKFNLRIENESVVIWKRGFTIWINVWGNASAETAKDRLDSLVTQSSQNAYDRLSETDEGILRHSYRLAETINDTRQAAFYCFAVGDSGHVQMAIYFESPDGIQEALRLWRSLTELKIDAVP